MSAQPVWLKPDTKPATAGSAGGCILHIHAQPGAARSAIAGEHGDALKIRIHAHPVEGAANAALLAFLAEHLGVQKSALKLIAGEAQRRKRVWVALPVEQVLQRLGERLKPPS